MNCYQYLCIILLYIQSIKSDCPDQCLCKETNLECHKIMPSFIPKNILKVNITLPRGFPLAFNSPGWKSVTHLTLKLEAYAGEITQVGMKKLMNWQFRVLESLKYLKIMCQNRLFLDNNVFWGIKSLKILDLSNNIVFSLGQDIFKGLTGNNNLPNLSELYLSNTVILRSTHNFFDLNTLNKAMKNKPLKVLDMSGTRASFTTYAQNLPALLPQLKILNISHAGAAAFFPNMYVTKATNVHRHFMNLKVLDISYPNFPLSQSECISQQLPTGTCLVKKYFHGFLPPNVTELYARKLFQNTGQFTGTASSSQLCLSTNFLSNNVSICITGRFNHLQKLDISENSIAYIQPLLIEPFEELKYLNIAKNKLGNALSNDIYAKAFFHALQHVEVLTVSDNGITCLAKDAFQMNKYLRILDLSHNKLDTVNFGIQHLVSLKHLDISFNKIVSLDSQSCNLLSSLTFKQNISENPNISQHNVQTDITLKQNPVSCFCENMCFLKLITELNETNTCSLNGQTLYINELTIRKTMYLCKKIIVITVFSVFALIMVMFIPISAYLVVKEKRKVRMKRLKESGIEMFEMNPNKYPVFLSFSGDDEEFVMTKVYPNLDSGLKSILNTESCCVVSGGTDFRPGYLIKKEIARWVEASSVIVFFLSENFCTKQWCIDEVYQAFNDDKPIVLMMWGKVNTAMMPRILRKHYETYTRVHWTMENGELVMRPDWNQLCETIVRLIGSKKQP